VTAAPQASISTYELLAAEYYDVLRHPTCANFRDASRGLLRRLVPDVRPASTCEVGCGDSLLAELLAARRRDLMGLLLTDAHPSMLEYSRRWAPAGAELAVARATSLPVADAALELVVASLADPYDDDDLWSEMRRVLGPGGSCIVTTPSSAWATRFRTAGDPPDTARFELADGGSVLVRSQIRPVAQQRELIERHDLTVTSVAELALDELAQPISRKLRSLDGDDAVVVGYVVAA